MSFTHKILDRKDREQNKNIKYLQFKCQGIESIEVHTTLKIPSILLKCVANHHPNVPCKIRSNNLFGIFLFHLLWSVHFICSRYKMYMYDTVLSFKIQLELRLFTLIMPPRSCPLPSKQNEKHKQLMNK